MNENPYEPRKVPSDRAYDSRAAAVPFPFIFIGLLVVGMAVLTYLVAYAVLN